MSYLWSISQYLHIFVGRRAAPCRGALRSVLSSVLGMIGHRIDGTVLTTKRAAKQRFRQWVLDSWGCACAYCGAPADTLDHVRARSRGGHTAAANLVAACVTCNQAKSSKDWLAWFRGQETWCEAREARLRAWCAAPGAWERPWGGETSSGDAERAWGVA